MRYEFPAILVDEQDGRVTAYFEGLPGATWGENRHQALERARDLLATAIEMLLEDGEAIPSPSPAQGRPMVAAEV
jgi:antitoxin HicB